MFHPAIGLYPGSQSASNVNMEAGDFDNTPAPSARPSLAVLRDSLDGRTVHLPEVPEIGRTGSFKHQLLKTSTSGPLIVDPDASAPPVLSRHSPPQPVRYDSIVPPQSHSENRPARVKEDVTPPKTPSPAVLPDLRGVSPDIPASERVCLDPTLHGKETHAHAHHPGLLKGADFCDYGAPTKDSGPVVASSGSRSPDELATPGYEGHSRAVKVRPAFNYQPMHDTTSGSVLRESQYGHIPSKVKPFDSRPPQVKSAEDGMTLLSSKLLHEDPDLITYQFPTSKLNMDLNVPTAKIRPYNHELIPEFVIHEFGLHENKVRPFAGAEPQQRVLNEAKRMEQVATAKRHLAVVPDRHSINHCNTYEAKTVLDQHPLSDDALGPDQTLIRRHTISVDEVHPVDVELARHSVGGCMPIASEMGVEGHKISQCPEFPV